MKWPWQKKDEIEASEEVEEKSTAHLRAGEWGEKHAARALGKKGYQIIGKRVRVGKRDELDIVARDGRTLVFVEVKTRKDESFGRPIDAVDREKKEHLSRAAVRYMSQLPSKPEFFRFDVIEIVGEENRGRPHCHHVENAFTLDKKYDVRW